MDIIDGYKGLGYGRSTEEELGLLISSESCSICHCTAGVVELLQLVRFWSYHFLCRNNDIHIYLGGISLLSLQLIVACWPWGVRSEWPNQPAAVVAAARYILRPSLICLLSAANAVTSFSALPSTKLLTRHAHVSSTVAACSFENYWSVLRTVCLLVINNNNRPPACAPTQRPLVDRKQAYY